MTNPTPDAIRAAVELLAGSGYLVAKIPPCNRNGGHGSHTLITRSVSCEGVEPVPHGWHSGHRGTFGWWNHCQCGHSFADYSPGDDGETPWQKHIREATDD